MPDYGSADQRYAPHTQRIGCLTDLIQVVPVVETTALDAGDVICDTMTITNAMREQGGTGELQTLIVYDAADQGAALDVYILDQDIDLGSLDAAPNISDANALNIIACIPVAAADYKDVGGIKIAFINNIGAIVKAEGSTRNLYASAITSGTPTFASASAVAFGFGFRQD